MSKSIGSALTQNGWVDFTFDLSDYAGDNIWLVLTNDANGGENVAARWARIEIVTE
jgi:bacillopeptidase F (M6 metalloprotease family)